MKRFEMVIATTHVDSQGERLTREALDSLVNSISTSYIPIGIEHDPRIPPQGRVDSGFVRQTSSGEFEAIAIMEIFETADEPSTLEEKREIILPVHRVNGLTVSYDWTHRSKEDQEDIKEIAAVLKNNPVYDVKKSADPISIIQLTGAFVLGGIAKGFVEQIGADGWNLIKKKLNDIFSRKKNRQGDQLFVFIALIERSSSKTEVEVILTNPSIKDMDVFLVSGLQTLDKVVCFYLDNAPDIRRLVFEIRAQELELKFAVRKDCYPLTPTVKMKGIIGKRD